MCWQLKTLLKDDTGAVFVDYALLVVLIAIVCFFSVTVFGQRVLALYQRFSEAYPG